MKIEIIQKFKSLFEEQKKHLLYSGKILNETFHLGSEETADYADMTSTEMETSMRMRLRNREILFLKKIDAALERISSGTFGACEKCEESIGERRLEARPTATTCVDCKEAEERHEFIHIDGHRHKSLGSRLKIATDE